MGWWPTHGVFFSCSWRALGTEIRQLTTQYLDYKVKRYQKQLKTTPLFLLLRSTFLFQGLQNIWMWNCCHIETWVIKMCERFILHSGTHVTHTAVLFRVYGRERYPTQSQISLTCIDLRWGHAEAGLRDAWHFSLQHLTLRTTRSVWVSVCLYLWVPLCHRVFISE